VATFPFIVEAGIFLDIVAGVLIMIVFALLSRRHEAVLEGHQMLERPLPS
jgi:hydrogenase-4 membrane subunit HyfE